MRSVCSRCRRAASVCWCAHLSPRVARADLVVLQHPREARNPIGTARMAHLGVTGSRIVVGVRFAGVEVVAPRTSGPVVVLYPTDDAQDVSALRDVLGPLTVIAIDGTWWQARKVWRENPWLHALPAFRVNPRAAGRYRIRREPAPHCLSTVEAIAALLDALDGQPDARAALLRPFDAMVGRQIACAAGATRRVRSHVRRAPPPEPGPVSALAQVAHRLVIVHGESNGWPARLDRARTELLQWEAVRPSTGEAFHAFVRPTLPRAPRALAQLELTDGAIAAAESSPEAFHAALERFARPGDVWCSWGHLPLTLLGPRPGDAPAIDLRAVCAAASGERHGSIEAAYRAIVGAADPLSSTGRGGRRVAQLAAIVQRLLSPPARGVTLRRNLGMEAP